MKVKDPKKIVTPSSGAQVDTAIHEMRAKNAMESNPIYQMMEQNQQQLAHLMAQQQVVLVRIQALTDYLASCGLLLHQDLDERGAPVGEAFTPEFADVKIYEALAEQDICEMPKTGYTAYFAEYSTRIRFITSVMSQVDKGLITFEHLIEHIRYFNAEEHRLAPISGGEFGLAEYLTENPDELDDEVLDTLADEFGLRKEVTEDDEGVVEDSEGPETEEVRTDAGTDEEEPQDS